MSVQSMLAKLNRVEAGVATPRSLFKDQAGNILLAYGTAVPSDAATGYKTGCIFIHTDGGDNTALYVNEGTAVSADFNGVAISSSTGIARSELQEDVLQIFPIPFGDVLGADGADLAITETAGDFYRNIGTNQLLILGEVSNGTVGADTEASVGWFKFVLPHNYVAGGDISIRAGVDVTGSGALGTCTIDFSAYLQNGIDGTVGADLVSTAATAVSATAANKDFVVTPTGLVAGDILIIKMTTSIDNTDSTAIQARISQLAVMCDVKG